MSSEHRKAFDEVIAASFRRVAKAVARLAWITGAEDAEDVTLEAFTRYLADAHEEGRDRMAVPTVDEVVRAVMKRAEAFAKSTRRREVRRRKLAHVIVGGRWPAETADPSLEETYAAAVRKAVDDLPTELRDVVRARSSGSSYADIAQTLALPEGTVKSRLHRARAILRERLAEGGGERPMCESGSG